MPDLTQAPVERARISPSVRLAALWLCAAQMGCNTDQGFVFYIDRTPSLATTRQQDLSVTVDFEQGSTIAFDWDASGTENRIPFRVLGRESAVVSVQASADTAEVASSGETPIKVSEGSRVCLFTPAQWQACAAEAAECSREAFTEGPRDHLCREPDEDTLALYTFDRQDDKLPGGGLGFDETTNFPAQLIVDGAARIVRGEDYCNPGSGSSFTRSDDGDGEYLQIYPHPREPEYPVAYIDLTDNARALEVAVLLEAGATDPQVILALEELGNDPYQFEVAALPDGDLRVRVARSEDQSPFYCFTNLLTIGTWTAIRLNFRNLYLTAIQNGDEIDPDQTGADCLSGDPISVSLKNDFLNREAPFTIGTSFKSDAQGESMGPKLRIDQLRILRSRIEP